MTYSDADVLGEVLSNGADIESGKEGVVNGSIFPIICLVIPMALMLGCVLYIPFAVHRDMQTSPVWEKNDYRICRQDGDPKTSKLTRFDAGSKIPDGCTRRLDCYGRLLDVGDTLDDWAWATYNAHGQGMLLHPDETPVILEFRQYDQIVLLLGDVREHKLLQVCDSLAGVEQLRCVRNVITKAGMDWSWAENEEIKDVLI